MLWSTLWNRLGKQKLKVMQHNHVYAILENPKTHQWEKVNLCLKFDATGRPYFIQEIPKETQHHKTSHTKQRRHT